MFDREMRYLFVSRRWRSDDGLGDADLAGKCHYEIFPEIPEGVKKIHQQGLAGQVLRVEADRFERADGSVQWLQWEVRPWFLAAGEVGGIVIFTEDITERTRVSSACNCSPRPPGSCSRPTRRRSWSINFATRSWRSSIARSSSTSWWTRLPAAAPERLRRDTRRG